MFQEPVTLQTLAELLPATLCGDASLTVRQLAAMQDAQPGDLTFAQDAKRAAKLKGSLATAAIVPTSVSPADDYPALLQVEDMDEAMNRLYAHLAGEESHPPVGIDPTAVIADDATIAADAAVGPHVVIGSGSQVGSGTVLMAGVKIGANVSIGDNCVLTEGVVVRDKCQIGHRVRIGCNAVVGHDGFGFYFRDGVHHKITHAGNVVVEDDVELGACCCVDRAKFGSTRIGRGSKVDNLVQIAHNVQIGAGTILVAQVGIAGSTRLGQYCVIGGAAGLRDNITLGNGVQVAAYSGMAKSAEDGEILAGTPARPAREAFRQLQAIPKLPDLLKRVKKLEKTIEKLQNDG